MPWRRSRGIVFSFVVGLVSSDSVLWLLESFLSFELIIIIVLVALILILGCSVRNGDWWWLVPLIAVLAIEVLLLYLYRGYVLRYGAFGDDASPVFIGL